MSRHLVPFGPVLLLALVAACSDGDGGTPPDGETCHLGTVDCGGVCIDLRTDGSNCGACGRACEPGDTCHARSCRRPCGFHRFAVGEIRQVGEAGLSATAADADGDGLAELAVADFYSGLYVVPQTSRGSFGDPVEVGEGNGAQAVTAVDLDGDGRDELVLGEGYEDRVLVLRGTDQGTFTKHWVERIGLEVAAHAVGDLDGDGLQDVVAASPGGGAVVLLRNTGGGKLDEFHRERVGGRPSVPAIGDFDGDGAADVAFSLENSSYLVVLYRRDDGYRLEQVDALEKVFGLAAGDLDGDGRDDLAVNTESGLAALLGRSSGPFERLGPVANPRSGLAAGDVDGDGLAEVVSLGGGKLRVFEVEANAVKRRSELEVGVGFDRPALVDLDGDRVLDLVGTWPASLQGGGPGQVMTAFSECG
jgi:hypothetical protein